jgi:pimeloyl-ACP methyl ester carboxylesterase
MKELNAQKFPKPFPELDPNLKKKFIKFHGADRAEFRYDLYRSFGGCYGCGYFDLRPVLQSIYHPSLVIYPDRSYIFDVAQGLAFYKHLQNGQLSVLPKCGHNTYEHQPQEYLKQLCVFWNQVSA